MSVCATAGRQIKIIRPQNIRRFIDHTPPFWELRYKKIAMLTLGRNGETRTAWINGLSTTLANFQALVMCVFSDALFLTQRSTASRDSPLQQLAQAPRSDSAQEVTRPS